MTVRVSALLVPYGLVAVTECDPITKGLGKAKYSRVGVIENAVIAVLPTCTEVTESRSVPVSVTPLGRKLV